MPLTILYFFSAAIYSIFLRWTYSPFKQFCFKSVHQLHWRPVEGPRFHHQYNALLTYAPNEFQNDIHTATDTNVDRLLYLEVEARYGKR